MLVEERCCAFPAACNYCQEEAGEKGASVRPPASVRAALGAGPAQRRKFHFVAAVMKRLGDEEGLPTPQKGKKWLRRVQTALPEEKAVSTLGRALWRPSFVFRP